LTLYPCRQVVLHQCIAQTQVVRVWKQTGNCFQVQVHGMMSTQWDGIISTQWDALQL
jgi:hypothetical protein